MNNSEVSKRAAEWECLHSINSWTIRHHVISLDSVFRRINISQWAGLVVPIKEYFIFEFILSFLFLYFELCSHCFSYIYHWNCSLLLILSLLRTVCHPFCSWLCLFLIFLSVHHHWISSFFIYCRYLLNACSSAFPLVLCYTVYSPPLPTTSTLPKSQHPPPPSQTAVSPQHRATVWHRAINMSTQRHTHKQIRTDTINTILVQNSLLQYKYLSINV